jgi:hypothetical protein
MRNVHITEGVGCSRRKDSVDKSREADYSSDDDDDDDDDDNDIVTCILVTREYMGSRFDNSIYWIISHVVTTIRYYTSKLLYLRHTDIILSRG